MGRDGTWITLAFRRDYTIKFATSFAVTASPFQTLGNGAILYRLVRVDYDILNRAISVTVQTRTSVLAHVTNVLYLAGSSLNVPPVTGEPNTGATCDPTSPGGKCDQFHTIRLSSTPCKVETASMTLTAVFECANGYQPNQCGFTNMPPANTFTLNNILLSYDACARVVQYGIDTKR